MGLTPGPTPVAGIQTTTRCGCWHRGHKGLWPVSHSGGWHLISLISVWPVAGTQTYGPSDLWSNSVCWHSDQNTHTYTENRLPQPGKELEMEFSKKIEQTALISCRAWPHQHGDQSLFTCNCPFLSSYDSIFTYMFLPKSPRSTIFSVFGSSPTEPRISPVHSPNAGPLHPIMCPIPLGSNSHWSKRCYSLDSPSLILMGFTPGRGLLSLLWQP